MRRAKKKELQQVDHSTMEYEPFTKKFYVESPEMTRLAIPEVEILRAKMGNIKIRV